MPELITVKLTPLIPLWTGDEKQQGGRVRETGIIGSLRWWYEAIVRGLGRGACDPSEGSCIYDSKEGLGNICLACQLFGCTGYGRRFRLVVQGEGNAGRPIEVKSRVSQKYSDSLGDVGRKHRGWRIPPNVAGPLSLTFYPTYPSGLDVFDRLSIYHTFRLIERYGAIGAKTSHGQGVFKVADWGGLPGDLVPDTWITDMQARPGKAEAKQGISPDLCEFIGLIVTLDKAATSSAKWWRSIPLSGVQQFSHMGTPTWIPSAPAVRVVLRNWLRSSDNIPNFTGNLEADRHRLMGQAGRNPKGADIYVTHLYKDGEHWSMRLFAFLPVNGNAVDYAVRKLLGSEKEICDLISLALGGITVSVDSYPNDIPLLLSGEKGGLRG